MTNVKTKKKATTKKGSVSEQKTAGAYSYELQEKAIAGTADNADSIELQRSVHKGDNSEKSYEEEVWDCIDRGRKDSSIQKDFYIVVLVKKERHLQNIIRQYFFYRQSCPTPEYDQTVYKYHRKNDDLEYLWTVANNVSCIALVSDLQSGALHPDHERLANMAEAFMNRRLDAYAAKLNGEGAS